MKKLIMLLMVMFLLAGCSGKKETTVKEEIKTEEKEPVSIESEETNETVYKKQELILLCFVLSIKPFIKIL